MVWFMLGRAELSVIAGWIGRSECALLTVVSDQRLGIRQVMSEREGLLDRYDLATMLGISPTTVSKWVTLGLPRVRAVGFSEHFYCRRQVATWLANNPRRAAFVSMKARQALRVPERGRRLTGDEVARRLEVKPGTVRRWRGLGCPAVQEGPRRFVFEMGAVLAWVKSRPRVVAFIKQGPAERYGLEVAHAG